MNGEESRHRRSWSIVLWILVGGLAVLALPLAFCWPLLPYGESRILPRAERIRPLMDAVEAYARDKGELPEKLDLLVPAYLPEVPTSKIMPDCRFMAYHLLGEDLFNCTTQAIGRNGEDYFVDARGEPKAPAVGYHFYFQFTTGEVLNIQVAPDRPAGKWKVTKTYSGPSWLEG